MSDLPLSRLCVVGLGLLGGSIARAARGRGVAHEITGVSRNVAALAQARAAGVVDTVGRDLVEGVRGAELVVLCAPVGILPALVQAAWRHLEPGAVLTDVGSVKGPVVTAADACHPRADVAFVGGHPMAGSERSGFSASRADLFNGCLTLLTPTAQTPDAALIRVTRFWEALGSLVRLLPVDAHDRAVGLVSHLPHLAAAALVAIADDGAIDVAGRGFSDTTRIAASAEALWADIFRGNRELLLQALGRYKRTLTRWETLIRAGDWSRLEAELGRARAAREKMA